MPGAGIAVAAASWRPATQCRLVDTASLDRSKTSQQVAQVAVSALVRGELLPNPVFFSHFYPSRVKIAPEMT